MAMSIGGQVTDFLTLRQATPRLVSFCDELKYEKCLPLIAKKEFPHHIFGSIIGHARSKTASNCRYSCGVCAQLRIYKICYKNNDFIEVSLFIWSQILYFNLL